MRRGQLRDYFAGVGVKRLSGVDAEPKRSHQHEVGTTREMRNRFFGGTLTEKFHVVYVWLGRDQDGISVSGEATHYDARAQDPKRSAEWRLYYSSNPVTDVMREGDTLFLAMDQSRGLYFIVAPQGSTSERQLSWLFDLSPHGKTFVAPELTDREMDYAARFILDEIGIELEDPDADKLDSIVERYGTDFPTTSEFSRLARLTLPEVRAKDDPDAALVAWLDHEEALFRRLERRIVAERIEEGFVTDDGTDVDAFIGFSLSVQNRRKSRRGYSLENHLEAVFRSLRVSYDRGAVTENHHRPDFLFPSADAYRAAPATGSPCLAMLGAKSTCKERWRQVLSEASKIPEKHLLTLEPGISERQTDQMISSRLQLLVPQPIQDTYTDNQQAWLLTLDDFIRDVRNRECK